MCPQCFRSARRPRKNARRPSRTGKQRSPAPRTQTEKQAPHSPDRACPLTPARKTGQRSAHRIRNANRGREERTRKKTVILNIHRPHWNRPHQDFPDKTLLYTPQTYPTLRLRASYLCARLRLRTLRWSGMRVTASLAARGPGQRPIRPTILC